GAPAAEPHPAVRGVADHDRPDRGDHRPPPGQAVALAGWAAGNRGLVAGRLTLARLGSATRPVAAPGTGPDAGDHRGAERPAGPGDEFPGWPGAGPGGHPAAGL